MGTVEDPHAPAKCGVYFATLIASLLVVLFDIAWTRRKKPHAGSAAVLLVTAVAAFVSTWYYITSWMYEEAAKYDDVIEYLKYADDFMITAYEAVAESPAHWYWSCQLLMYAVMWVVYLGLSRAGTLAYPVSLLSCLAYMWVGFGGAMSVTSALFLTRMLPEGFVPQWGRSRAKKDEGKKPPSPKQIPGLAYALACVAVSLPYGCVVMLPSSVGTPNFGGYLAVLHVSLLLLPAVLQFLLGGEDRADHRSALSCSLILTLSIAIAASHIYNIVDVYKAGSSSAVHLWQTVWSNKCQASITLDLFFCWGLIMWQFGQRPARASWLPYVTPIVSPAAALGLYLADFL